MGRIRRAIKRFRLTPFDRGDHSVEAERSVENPDALAGAHRQGLGGLDQSGATPTAGYPPGYVKPDDGRPRH